MFPCAPALTLDCVVFCRVTNTQNCQVWFCNNERLMSHLQLSKNKHNGCSLYLSNVLAEFRFSTSKDSKLHLVLGCKITLLQGRSPVIWQLKSTEERRSIHCLTKSGNQRVQYRRKRIDPLFDDIRFISYDNWRDGLFDYKGRHSFANRAGEFPNRHVHYLPHSLVQFDPVPNIFTISSPNTKRAKS